MPWEYEYVRGKNNEASIELEVIFRELDEKGKALREVSRGYAFRKDACPTRAEMDRLLASDMVQIADSSTRAASLLDSIGSKNEINIDSIYRTEPIDATPVDVRLIALKTTILSETIDQIIKDPACGMDELIDWVSVKAKDRLETVAAMIVVLCDVIGAWALEAGISAGSKFDDVKAVLIKLNSGHIRI